MKQPQAKEDDLAYAATTEGYVLPVIDVTHPRFAVPDDPQRVRVLYEEFARQERRRQLFPKFIMRLMLRSAAKRSLLVKAMFSSDANFLDGMSTYVMKLGAANLLPPFDGPIDRRLAALPHIELLRLRTQQTARLVAEGLVPDLAAAENAPLHVINIGGGPAIDSINSLILLNRRRPDLIRRPIVIHVLDGDPAGPFFGANALAALKAEGCPLSGLNIVLEHKTYNWNDPASLAQLVRELTSQGAIVAASSEGALFEYGSDEAIIMNLRALMAAGTGARLVAGSVTSADAFRRRMIAMTKFKLIPRGIEGFAPLAAQAGAKIAQIETAGLSQQVLLRAA